jgi:hypothetical protein
MSQVVVASTAAGTGVMAAALLAAAGVAVSAACRLASTITDRELDLERVLGAPAIGNEFTRSMQAARERLEAEYVGACSFRPLAARQEAEARQVARQLAHAEATCQALRQQPALALVAEAHHGARLQEAVARLENARQSFQRGALDEAARCASLADGELRASSQAALNRLAIAHQTVVSHAFRQAFVDLGYRVQEAGSAGTAAMRAVRGAHVLGVAVLEGGKTVVDAAGFEGLECRTATAELFQRVRELGVTVDVEVQAPHRKREGGVLLSESNTADEVLRAAKRLRSRTGAERPSAPPDSARRRTVAGAIARLRGASRRAR